MVARLSGVPLPAAVDSLRGWFEFRWSKVKWAVQSHWRRARRHHGAFKHGEVSTRAAELTDLWERSWAEADPLSYVLRLEYADRWIRFHSLPESKRYAERPPEYDEILRRHRTLLHELHGSENFQKVHVIAADWDSQVLGAGWSKRRLPGVWPWRGSPADEDPDGGRNYFWAASDLARKAFDALLIAVADDECRVVIGAPDLTWLYCPYDGGADVLLPSAVERDALRARHADWLPAYPGGL